MQIRSPGVPSSPDPTPPPADAVAFRVPGRVIGAKIALAALVGLLTLLARDRPQLVIGVVATGLLAAYAARDIVARERLRADRAGLSVARPVLGRVELPWSAVETVRVDERGRLGVRTALLEIDAGDSIFQLSRYEIGVDPADALATLAAVRGD